MQKDVLWCFIDYEKAFDTVKHKDLLSMLNSMQFGGQDIRIIRKLYHDQTAAELERGMSWKIG